MAEVSNTSGPAKIEQIVAIYAPIGARKRRKETIRRAGVAGSVVALTGCAALLSITGLPEFTSSVESSAHQETLNQLVRERADFAAKMAQLESQIEGIKAQKSDLEAQQAALVEQSEMLAQFMDSVGAEQSNLEQRQQQGSQLDEEIAAIASQRKALEQRWEQFEAQGELLAMEIIAVNAQRKELESQRQQIARQRQELEELLERANGLQRQNTRSAERGAVPSEDETTAAAETLAQTIGLPTVDSEGLDEMRGGFTIGKGLDVTFGFTQTGSVNGVDQYKNNFTIGSMAGGVQDVDMSNMNSVVLQNGMGNFVSSGVLDSLSDSFGNVIQNTLDDQVISTTTIYDISLHNVPGAVQGLAGEQALMDSVGAF